MTKKNPTIRELLKVIGCERNQVNDRNLSNNLNTPVLSYAVGYAGFIAVYVNKNKQLNAVGCSVKDKESFQYPTFVRLRPEDAIERIKNENLFKHKKEADLKNLPEEVHTKPHVGKLKLVNKNITFDKWLGLNSNVNNESYVVSRYKNRKLHVEKESIITTTIKEETFLHTLEKIERKNQEGKLAIMTEEEYKERQYTQDFEGFLKNVEIIIFENTLPPDLAEEIRQRKMIKDIKK